jgi:hypothetical protein
MQISLKRLADPTELTQCKEEGGGRANLFGVFGHGSRSRLCLVRSLYLFVSTKLGECGFLFSLTVWQVTTWIGVRKRKKREDSHKSSYKAPANRCSEMEIRLER